MNTSITILFKWILKPLSRTVVSLYFVDLVISISFSLLCYSFFSTEYHEAQFHWGNLKHAALTHATRSIYIDVSMSNSNDMLQISRWCLSTGSTLDTIRQVDQCRRLSNSERIGATCFMRHGVDEWKNHVFY